MVEPTYMPVSKAIPHVQGLVLWNNAIRICCGAKATPFCLHLQGFVLRMHMLAEPVGLVTHASNHLLFL